MNNQGSPFFSRYYGTPDNELIKGMLLQKGVLFLGGDLMGQTVHRPIGDMNFFKMSGNEDHGFTSYVLIDNTTSNLRSQNSSSDEDRVKVPLVDMHPNPTSGDLILTLSKELEGVYSIELNDLQGRRVKDVPNAFDGTNRKAIISLSDLPNNMYLVKITNPKGEVIEVQKIIKN